MGGELYATYNKKGLFGKEPHAKFYTAGVVLAFEHMHSKKIIFRASAEPFKVIYVLHVYNFII